MRDFIPDEPLKTKGQKTEGQKTKGQKTEGLKTEGQKTEGQKTEGLRVHGKPQTTKDLGQAQLQRNGGHNLGLYYEKTKRCLLGSGI